MTYIIYDLLKGERFFTSKAEARKENWKILEQIADKRKRYDAVSIYNKNCEIVEKDVLKFNHETGQFEKSIVYLSDGLFIRELLNDDGSKVISHVADSESPIGCNYHINGCGGSWFSTVENARKGCLLLIRARGFDKRCLTITGEDGYTENCGIIRKRPICLIDGIGYKCDNQGNLSKAKTYRVRVE